MKSLYEKAFSAITKIIDKQIDAYEDQKDAAIKALEAERDARKEAIEQQKEQLQEQIDSIEKQISLKQEEIDAINDANKAKETEINLEKERYNLMRLMNQRTNLVYKGGQMVYMADEAAIKDQQQKVQESEDQVRINKIEQEITVLEKRKSVLEEQQDALDKQLEKIDEYYDKLIAQTEASFDALIKGLEEYKSRWEELAEIEEQAEMQAILEELEITNEDVLSMSAETFEEVKAKYLACLKDLYAGNEEMTKSIGELGNVKMDGLVGHLKSTQEYIDGLNEVNFSNMTTALEGLQGGFGNVADSVKEVASAVGVGTSSADSKGGETGSTGKGGESAASTGGSNSLFGAISSGSDSAQKDVEDLGKAFAGSSEGENDSEGEGGGTSLKDKINEVTDAVGDAETDNSMIGTIAASPEAVQPVIEKMNSMFESLRDKVWEVTNAVYSLIAAINQVNSMSVSPGYTANKPGYENLTPFATGTVGNAFADGTRYNGLDKREKNALVSEYGQQELTVLPNGKTILTDEPTLMDLPKGTVIYDNDQTKRILSGKQVLGKAYATGTSNNEALYSMLSHAIFDKENFDMSMLNTMSGQILDSINTHVSAIDTTTTEIARNISHVKNDSNNTVDVTIGDIHLHEVQKVDGLADAIHRRLPSMVMQRLNK